MVAARRFGYKTYTRCRDPYTRAQDQCRGYRGRDYSNTYNRWTTLPTLYSPLQL